jgi:hypothetical protein
MTTRIPGYVLTDTVVDVPLDHAADHGGRTIEVFAREVVAVDHEHDEQPVVTGDAVEITSKSRCPKPLWIQGNLGLECRRPVLD